MIGYLIESDNNITTGEPPYGFDYEVSFGPLSSNVYLFRYDMDWIPLDPTGITVKYLYSALDARVPVPTFPLLKVIGIELAVPLELLTRRVPEPGPGEVLSFIAFAGTGPSCDYCPDVGFSSIVTIWWYDLTILSVTPSKTIVGEGNRLTVGVIVWNEGKQEDFSIYVDVFCNSTQIGQFSIGTLPSQSEEIVLIVRNPAEIPKGRYTLSAVATITHPEEEHR